MPDDALNQLMDRTRRLFLPVRVDFMSLESHMVSTVRHIKDYLSSMPIDVTNPLSQAMMYQGKTVQHIHTQFVSDLTNRGSTFYSQDELIRRQRNSSLAANTDLVSHKRLLDTDHDTSSKKKSLSKTALLGALRDLLSQEQKRGGDQQHEDDSNSDVVELDKADAFSTLLAAFANRPASVPGRTGTPYTRGGEARSQTARPQSLPVEQAPHIAVNRSRPTSSSGKQRCVTRLCRLRMKRKRNSLSLPRTRNLFLKL